MLYQDMLPEAPKDAKMSRHGFFPWHGMKRRNGNHFLVVNSGSWWLMRYLVGGDWNHGIL